MGVNGDISLSRYDGEKHDTGSAQWHAHTEWTEERNHLTLTGAYYCKISVSVQVDYHGSATYQSEPTLNLEDTRFTSNA